MSRWKQYKLTESSLERGWVIGLKATGWFKDPSLREDIATFLRRTWLSLKSGEQILYEAWPVGPYEHSVMHLGRNKEIVYLRFKNREDALLFKLMSGAG